MEALVNEAKNSILLLKKKIEYCITNNKAICISIESAFMSLLNKIYVEDYNINDDYNNERLYLSDDNFEFTISFDEKTNITYDDEEDSFKIKSEESEIVLYCL